jgi:RNase P protein component
MAGGGVRQGLTVQSNMAAATATPRNASTTRNRCKRTCRSAAAAERSAGLDRRVLPAMPPLAFSPA